MNGAQLNVYCTLFGCVSIKPIDRIPNVLLTFRPIRYIECVVLTQFIHVGNYKHTTFAPKCIRQFSAPFSLRRFRIVWRFAERYIIRTITMEIIGSARLRYIRIAVHRKQKIEFAKIDLIEAQFLFGSMAQDQEH